jgi:hypothetical protein
MTFLEMQTEVFRRLEESSSSPVFWALAQVKEALNDAYFLLSDVTEWAETSESESFTTATYYDLSSVLTNTVLSIKGIFNPDTNRWLRPTTTEELDQRSVLWEEATGAPDEYVIRGLWWLGLYPKMASATGTMTIHYTYVPTALSANGDTPSFPEEFHPALVEYAVYDLLCQERETDKALKFYARYLDLQEKLKRYVQDRASYDRVVTF